MRGGGGGANKKTFRGASMNIFWNCSVLDGIVTNNNYSGSVLLTISLLHVLWSSIRLKIC